ncbi:unannotated protein [freshwater metagenome]|uniref:Unannotated protein n=1 Tax=freshwater metagenome TaxID=449393 RepID=A0A6J7WEL8_9ZZZZ
MQQLKAPNTVKGDFLNMFNIEHGQAIYGGGFRAHPIVCDHGL